MADRIDLTPIASANPLTFVPRPLPELQAERYGLNGGGAALPPNHRLVELQEPVEHPAADAVLVDYDIGEVVEAPLRVDVRSAFTTWPAVTTVSVSECAPVHPGPAALPTHDERLVLAVTRSHE